MTLSPEYVAGLFDGEGCISLSYSSRQIHVGITWKPTLELLQNQYGGGISIQKKRNAHHKQSWQWYLSDKQRIKKFLSDVLPFLHEKKEQAEMMLMLVELPRNKNGCFNELLIQARQKLKEFKERQFVEENVPKA